MGDIIGRVRVNHDVGDLVTPFAAAPFREYRWHPDQLLRTLQRHLANNLKAAILRE